MLGSARTPIMLIAVLLAPANSLAAQVQIYLEQVKLQLARKPRPLPAVTLNPAVDTVFDFTYEDFTLENYDPHPGIKAPIAV